MADEQPNIVPPDTSLVVAWAGEEVSYGCGRTVGGFPVEDRWPCGPIRSDTSWRCEPR